VIVYFCASTTPRHCSCSSLPVRQVSRVCMAESASKNVCYTRDLDIRSREQARMYAPSQGRSLSERGPRRWSLSLPLPFSTRRRASITPVSRADSTQCTTSIEYAGQVSCQRSGSKQLTAITPCPALGAILSELWTGRRRFDGRCFRCSKTGCALHTGYADYEEREHWHTEADGGGLAAGFMPSAI
jgi:hypothetical protein